MSRFRPLSGKERAALARFRLIEAYGRKVHGMTFEVAPGGRASTGRIKIGNEVRFFHFHPYKDLCFIDGRRHPERGCRAIVEAIRGIAAGMARKAYR